MTEVQKIKYMAGGLYLFFMVGFGVPTVGILANSRPLEALVPLMTGVGACWIIRRLTVAELNHNQKQEK